MRAPAANKPHLIHFTQTGSSEDGFLISTQLAEKLPFPVKRIFWLQQVPENKVRGHHAHHTTQEVLVVLQGQVAVTLESLAGECKFLLNQSDTGLFIPARTWVKLTFSDNAIALCLASTDFEEADYIRDYAQFRQICLASR
ncbi:MAG: hypothetical protein JWQ14_3454 [Adhaeribacter sp.]|nr:hypothetical protein [Adhaeribacter sp.]